MKFLYIVIGIIGLFPLLFFIVSKLDSTEIAGGEMPLFTDKDENKATPAQTAVLGFLLMGYCPFLRGLFKEIPLPYLFMRTIVPAAISILLAWFFGHYASFQMAKDEKKPEFIRQKGIFGKPKYGLLSKFMIFLTLAAFFSPLILMKYNSFGE